MTQREILNLNNLKVAELKPNMFLHIHAKDGFIITAFKEGDDITKYVGSVCYYMSIKNEYPDYRVITADMHNNYVNMRNSAIKEKQNKR